MEEASARKHAQKSSPKSLFNFCKQPKTAILCNNLFYKLDILKLGLSKGLKKVALTP